MVEGEDDAGGAIAMVCDLLARSNRRPNNSEPAFEGTLAMATAECFGAFRVSVRPGRFNGV